MQEIFKDFPNLHPLFVHFPIVLLLLAATTQIAILFFPKNSQLKWLTFFLIATGSLGAYMAMQTGTHLSGDADEKAFDIFETHYLFARLTFWTSLAASIIRLIALKWYAKRWMEYILVALFITIAVFVTITAHHGAKMVYIYNVGPQGNGILSE